VLLAFAVSQKNAGKYAQNSASIKGKDKGKFSTFKKKFAPNIYMFFNYFINIYY